MIETPKRSVTRFFIPLIDVLILLFGVLIVLPVSEQRNAIAVETEDGKSEQVGEQQIRNFKEQIKKLEKELEDLRKMQPIPEELRKRLELLEKDPAALLVIYKLHINPDNGFLFYDDGISREQIKSERDLLLLIRPHVNGVLDRQKKAPPPGGGKYQLLYVLQYPLKKTFFPTRDQEQKYLTWSEKIQSEITQVKISFRLQKPPES